ncbi:MAG: TolC family outer membrane protein [Campylobacterales bacterium]|nr:TolC family outer membrane protein [Campylobacterales bacterium]
MNKKILLALSLCTLLNAQNLKTTVEEVLSTNPTILEQLKNYNSTKEDVTIAQAGYYPKLDVSVGAGYDHADRKNFPVVKNTAFDYNLYTSSVTYTQNIFKGFETTYQIKENENRTLAAAYKYIEQVNAVSFAMVNTYLQVLRQKELLNNAKETIDINEEIIAKVQKLYDSGLTTLSEVNKIESSLALAKSNYVVQENTLLDVTYNMHAVLGRYLDIESMEKPTEEIRFPQTVEDAAQFAMQNNPSLLVSKYNIKLAEATNHKSKAPFYPKLDVQVSEIMSKNKGALQADGESGDFRAMAYLSYNLFNGFADTAALQKSVSEVHKEVQIKNKLIRNTIEDLNLAWSAYEKLNQQMVHLQRYRAFAEKTLTLYKKEYDLGRRTLLDLLSAQSDFSNSKSQIINTEYSALFAKYRILDALGTLVPSVMGSEDIEYEKVGLKGETPPNNDTLPVTLDADKDLIVDEQDICNNSLSYKMRSTYGCEITYDDTLKIERYSGFVFGTRNADLTQKGQKKLNDLIAQIQPYGFENMKFEVFGNVDDENLNETKMLLLSAQRANVVKEKLVKAGAKEENITIHAQSNKAPMFTNGLFENEGLELNNRVDIAVRKLKLPDADAAKTK